MPVERFPERETARVYTGSNTFEKEESKTTVSLNIAIITVKFVKIIEKTRK